MSLLFRINTALGAVFLLAASLAGYVCWSMLSDNAQREVLAEAGLMMDSAAAVRTYTSGEILPLISARMKDEFLPQSVPSYAATQNFLKFHEHHPEYAYKEATLNPTNPRDRAADWESDIIERSATIRNSADGRRARHADGKIVVSGAADSCKTGVSGVPRHPRGRPCHVACPLWDDNGFGWQPNEVVAAQVVSVPFARRHGQRRQGVSRLHDLAGGRVRGGVRSRECAAVYVWWCGRCGGSHWSRIA